MNDLLTIDSSGICDLCHIEKQVYAHPHLPIKTCIPCLLADLNQNILNRGAKTEKEALDYKANIQ